MFHGSKFICLLYYWCLVYSYESLNFYALLIFKNGKRWYCEGKYIKRFSHACKMLMPCSCSCLHARAESCASILDQLQKLGMVVFRNLSFQIKYATNCKIKWKCLLLFMCMCPLQTTVASPFSHCQNNMQMQLTLQFHHSRYKNFKQLQVLWYIVSVQIPNHFSPQSQC